MSDDVERGPIARIAVRHFSGHMAHAERLTSPVRIAHLTDPHVGLITPMRAQERAIALTNAEKPDVVLLTGDFVAHSWNYLDALEALLLKLDAPAFAVLGNHDHWAGAPEVRRALFRAGVEVLSNVNTRLTIRGEALQVVGIDDSYTEHSDVEKATRGLDRSLPTVGLAHIPEDADALWAKGVPMVFSGHTHAGQITWARLNELALGKVVGHRYVHGLYGDRTGEGAVYVSAGIGASVMPVRLGERGRREVAIFELGAAPGAFAEHHGEQVAHPGKKPSARVLARRARRLASKQRKQERLRAQRRAQGIDRDDL